MFDGLVGDVGEMGDELGFYGEELGWPETVVGFYCDRHFRLILIEYVT